MLQNSSLRLPGVQRGSPPLLQVKRIRTPKAAREFLGLSQGEVAAEMTKRLGLKSPMNRSVIANYEARRSRTRKTPPRKIPEEQVQVYGQLLINRLSQLLERDDIRMTVHVNSPWKIWVGAYCKFCGRHYEIKRSNQFCSHQKANSKT
jgi:hypothetical protein